MLKAEKIESLISVGIVAILIAISSVAIYDITNINKQTIAEPEEKNIINFDDNFKYIDCSNYSGKECQIFIDDGYIAYDRGDYNHHAGFLFNMLCDKSQIGENIIIGGKQYEVVSKEYGEVIGDNVYVGDTPIYDNGITQVLHCTPEPGGRYVMTIKEIVNE